MNFRDKIEWVLAALGCVLAALGCYLIRYKSKVDNLKTQVEELRGARDSLQHDVDTAIRNLMKIEDDVERRLTESDDIIAVAEKILEDDNKGWYLNMMSRYQVSKRADKAASEAKNLKDEISKINSVGYRESTQVVETVTSNGGYEAFESRMPTITGVLEALKDHNVTRIGIHGMGGIGKTMLVKEVLKQAEKEKLFDKYLFLVVSNNPDLKRIQGEIAEQLDLKLEVESELVRRVQLRKRLKQENRVLIILDDIWKYLDLEALGIFSFGDGNKGCKLLLTSRFYNVVCNDMDTQKQFEVKVFLNDEARGLFEKIVGDLAKSSEIKPTMLQIVEECAGLPIAITTIANALKNQKNLLIWKDFLNQLKMSSPREIEGMNEKVYKSIKMSYEFLKSNEAKSLLLLCSLHGEDDDIEVEDLLRYGVGLGLFDNVGTIEGARCRVHSFVERLKDSSLLLDGDDNGTVKMHDVIRDVVINIAAEEKHMFTIKTAIELQNLSKREDAVAISLPYINDDLELPNQFECSKLELLLLFYQRVDFRIPDSFFEGLKDLKVLMLSRSWSGVLPSSLSSLENLQTLCLSGEVQNAITIGELKNLKALSISLFNTERIPKEIGKLTHLQLLDLGKCSQLKFIPPNVLSNLKRLEELYLPDNVEWEVEVQSTEKINAMVSELDHLSHLTKLHICIKNAKILPKAMVFERLESYRVAIGSALFLNETSETSRIFKLNISLESDYGYKVLLRKCESLFLGKIKGVKNILYELESEGFPCLKHLKVENNDEIQYIVKSMGVRGTVFPILESIKLQYVNTLERISYTRLPTESFCNLRVVKVSNCCQLEFVFSSSMVGCFSHLQEMNIEDCEIMSAIVAIEREEDIEVNSDDNIMFSNLQSLRLRNLLKLKGFLSVVDSLALFNGKVVFPNLKELEIRGMDSMKMIWSNQLISDYFGKLEKMTVSRCTNLTNIVPPNMLRTLRNLKELNIYDCDSVEEVYDIQGTNSVKESHDIAATELIFLKLRNLEKVKHVWSMDPQGIITFAKLRTITVEGCSSLKSVFPTSVAKALMQLKMLEIEDCATVEEIVAKEEGIEKTTLFVFPQLETLALQNLPELKSFYPGKHILECPLLDYLHISKCDKLKIFVSNKSSVQETNELAPHANLIQQPHFFIEKVVSPNLEELEIKGMDSMKMIWFNQLISNCFRKLETMTVSGRTNLKNTVSPNMLRMLRNLKELNIYDCDSLEEVYEIQGTNNVEASRDIVAAELISLKLRNLEKMKHVWSMDPQGIITFAKLRTITIKGCSSLKSVFPTSVAKDLMQLEMLEIEDCVMVEEIVAKEEGIETSPLFVFSQLETLALQNLPELKSFYPGKHILECPLLVDLCISKCEKLKIFGSSTSSVQETNGLAHHANLIQQSLFFIEKDKFPNLEYLELDEGDAMNETCGGSSAEFCCNLKVLALYGNGEIPNVEAPIARAGVSDFRRLKNIVPFSSTSFHYLKELDVYNCDELISLLTPSTARTLVQLERIEIWECKRMTEIVANEGSEAEARDEIAFNNLKYLRFDNLRSLTAFHLGNRTIKFPSLDYAILDDCPKLKIFCSGVLSTPKLIEVWMEGGKQILKKEGDEDGDLNATIKEYWEAKLETCNQKFVEKLRKASQSLPESSTAVEGSLPTTQGSLPEYSLTAAEGSLPTTQVSLPESTSAAAECSLAKTQASPESSSPMTKTPKISDETDVLTNHQSNQDGAQDVFSFQRMKVSEISQLQELPKNLHSLKIEGCDVLENIPEEVIASIPILQRLYIINCCSLKSFPEPIALKILHIQNCKKLEFPPPARKTNQYALLEHLCIGNSCDFLTSLSLNLFPKLRCLSIWDCKNLKSFSMLEGNQKDLTSLEALEIRDCPNLLYFPKGGLPTPNLTSIWLSKCEKLKELPHQLYTLNSLLSIFINNCPELVSLPEGGLPSNLSLLCITSCDKLTLMRDWGLLRLDSLIKLEIEGGCENVESFPEEKLLPSNLNSLRVSRLLNLQYLDYKGLQHLTALKTLEISCCDKLEFLPEEGLPSSLSVLCIKECSLLRPKLQKQTGDYWPKIAHISFIETDEEVIPKSNEKAILAR